MVLSFGFDDYTNLPIVAETATTLESYTRWEDILRSLAMWGMTGGIEYHARNATMNDSHAYIKGRIWVWSTVNRFFHVPNAVPSCGGISLSAYGSLTPCQYPALF